MQLPLQISFHGLDRSEALEANVRKHASKLEEFWDRMTCCQVVLEKPHRHRHQGSMYHVRIRVAVPRRELVVDREPEADHAHEDPYVTVRDAFKAMRRQLEDYAREIRGNVKSHAEAPQGHIARLFPDDGFGFLQSVDGREIYFHRNSVLDDGFSRLEVGSVVTFIEEQGDKGPQASTVRVTGRTARLEPDAQGSVECRMPRAIPPNPESLAVEAQDARARPAEESIRVRAYERWEFAGRPASDGIQFWLEAEQELTQPV